jgi:copper chaperone
MLKFKTNIKCAGCIATVTPKLNEKVGENNWQVDIQDPNKILTIETNTPAEEVISTLAEVGYKADTI